MNVRQKILQKIEVAGGLFEENMDGLVYSEIENCGFFLDEYKERKFWGRM